MPVVGYLSGGVNSAYVLATASRLRNRAIPSFTIQVPGKSFDETQHALATARHIGSRPTILTSDAKVISDTYAKLIASADCPVPDTSCAALWCLSQEVHDQGFKVALTGEGSDEAFGGYVWFKVRNFELLDGPGQFPARPMASIGSSDECCCRRTRAYRSCGASMPPSAVHMRRRRSIISSRMRAIAISAET